MFCEMRSVKEGEEGECNSDRSVKGTVFPPLLQCICSLFNCKPRCSVDVGRSAYIVKTVKVEAENEVNL